MKCPFCNIKFDNERDLEEVLVHLTANHFEKIPFPFYVKFNKDGSQELLEEITSATGLGADLQPLMDRCGVPSKVYGYQCLEPKGHTGVHQHFPWVWQAKENGNQKRL